MGRPEHVRSQRVRTLFAVQQVEAWGRDPIQPTINALIGPPSPAVARADSRRGELTALHTAPGGDATSWLPAGGLRRRAQVVVVGPYASRRRSTFPGGAGCVERASRCWCARLARSGASVRRKDLIGMVPRWSTTAARSPDYEAYPSCGCWCPPASRPRSGRSGTPIFALITHTEQMTAVCRRGQRMMGGRRRFIDERPSGGRRRCKDSEKEERKRGEGGPRKIQEG